MDNPETLTTLGTVHRTQDDNKQSKKTKQNTTQHRKLKR